MDPPSFLCRPPMDKSDAPLCAPRTFSVGLAGVQGLATCRGVGRDNVGARVKQRVFRAGEALAKRLTPKDVLKMMRLCIAWILRGRYSLCAEVRQVDLDWDPLHSP